MDRHPIFIGVTRSFWSAVATLALMTEMGEPVVRAVVTLAAGVFGGDANALTEWTMTVLPIVTLILAMQQRSGAARPYTLDPRAVK
ncbi:hypothetical protein [Hoeflea sp.]|uniref:hypothetical protein n=1 Tax=Hoeflea sp. TaxID=1940281 RepID=UPI001985CADA|nr:hypothetical protein [Hoeflea sp.]MBC7282589.1 hypothetical protein [Hoeflea sp.]